jgi:NTE family protein
MAIPGLYPPQQIGAHTLVDGGVVNPVPSNVTAVMGADIVIAVKLARRSGPLAVENEAQQATNRSQSVLQTLLRSFEMMQSKIITEAAAKATILIEPVFGTSSNYGLRSFMEGRSYIELGEAAALAALPRIAAALPWLR